ncbi:MAG: YceD family protein [Tomitella sp.]|nr:YceD family protein [Tomitella sp.]
MSTRSGKTGKPAEDSPYVFDVRSLGRRPGQMETAHRAVRAPGRLGLDVIAIEPGAELDLDLRLESVMEGVLVSGVVSGVAVGECVRCLREVEEPVELQLTELFAFPDSVTEDTTDAEEIPRVVDGRVDIEQAVVDGVGLELPLQPLCRDDCPGLCSVCGIDLAIADPDHGHDTIDPRWAALAAKFGDVADQHEDRGGQDAPQDTDHQSEES